MTSIGPKKDRLASWKRLGKLHSIHHFACHFRALESGISQNARIQRSPKIWVVFSFQISLLSALKWHATFRLGTHGLILEKPGLKKLRHFACPLRVLRNVI